MGWSAPSGPSCKDFEAFKASFEGMPEKHKPAYDGLAQEAGDALCDPTALHVWETDADLDSLLQLTQVIVKIRGTNTPAGPAQGTPITKPVGMVTVTEISAGRNNFDRVCEQIKYLTKSDGKSHLSGSAMSFGTIVVVKGVNNLITADAKGKYPTASQKGMDEAVKLIDVTIERVFKMSGVNSDSKKKLVWHHGPVLHFLLHFINNTTSTLRNALKAVTVHSALDLQNRVKSSALGKLNKVDDFKRLEAYCKKLAIPAVLLDCTSQLITHDCLATYVYYCAWYIHLLIAPSVLRAHLHAGQDQLLTFAFRLRGAAHQHYEDKAVKDVQKVLSSTAKHWAKQCVSPAAFTKEKCRAAGSDAEIHYAVLMATTPFALLRSGDSGSGPGPRPALFAAFARLYVGPAAGGISKASYVAAPVGLDFKHFTMYASTSSPFRLYFQRSTPPPVSSAGQADIDKATARVQGTLMAVLEILRQERGAPPLGDDEKKMWELVRKAMGEALDGLGWQLPAGVEDKVKHVQQRLKQGMWTWVLGSAGGKAGTRRA